MPPPAKKSRRRTRCCYRENSRTCVRDGSGNPPLCKTHRDLVEAQARAASATPPSAFGGVVGLIEDLIAGRKVSPRRAEKTVREAVARAAGNAMRTPGFTPFRPFGAFAPFAPFGNQAQPQPTPQPPPRPDPVVELDAERARARQVMGFAPGQRLTEAEVKTRKRELAKRLHPDKPGGSLEKMQHVNDAADVLFAEIAG